MYEPRYNVTVTYPTGRRKTFRAYMVWTGTRKVTWCSVTGLRSYVLLNHGFSVNITNIPVDTL